jgi:uncharacterized membrane protein (DUF4010 family)
MPDSLAADVAARAIAVGILANTVFKSAMAAVLGARGFRVRAFAGLMPMAATILLALMLL